MSAVPPARRLAAVLIADVVGYARLMERNETGTHTRLRAVRAEVTDPAIAANQGRIVRTVGDGLLVEFGSATDALRAAIAIQRDMRSRNEGVPPDERIDYRIGINLGDIIVTPDDLEGAGVNLAARLEALAPPGGICVSQAVQEQLREDLDVTFVDAGEQRVKNIARPVRVYHVVLQPLTGWDATAARWRRLRRHAGARGVAAGLVVLALGLAVALGWWREKPFAPPRFSIATLPFAPIPPDVQNTQLATGLHAELRNGLSRLRNGGTFTAPRAALHDADPRAVARELNVRHVLTGTLRRDNQRIDVQAQLIDGETGAAAWSDQFWVEPNEAARADRLAAARLTAALRLELLRLEARRAEAKPAPARDATDLTALAHAALYSPSYADRTRMKEIGANLEQALALQPDLVLALTARADWLMYEAEYLPPAAATPLKVEALALARRAVALASDDSATWTIYGSALEANRDMGPALEALERALQLDPANANALLYKGRMLLLIGRFDDALSPVREAAALAPQVQDVAGSAALIECQAHYFMRAYAQATAACERATGLGVDGYATAMLLAVLYARDDQMAKALAAKERVLQEFPDFRLSTFFDGSFEGVLGERNREFVAELRKLGFAD